MPRRFRRFARRFARRVRRVNRRTYRLSRSRVPGPAAVHSFKRTVDITPLLSYSGNIGNASGTLMRATQGVVTLGTSIYYGAACMPFKIADLPNVAEFTALFDQYKIWGITVKITPVATMSAAAVAAGTSPSTGIILHTCLDYDDATNFAATNTGVDAMREYESYRSYQPYRNGGKPITLFFKPRIASNVYGSGAFGSFANMKAPWLDAASTGVEHYGLKLMMETIDGATSAIADFKVEATYHIKMRGCR